MVERVRQKVTWDEVLWVHLWDSAVALSGDQVIPNR